LKFAIWSQEVGEVVQKTAPVVVVSLVMKGVDFAIAAVLVPEFVTAGVLVVVLGHHVFGLQAAILYFVAVVGVLVILEVDFDY